MNGRGRTQFSNSATSGECWPLARDFPNSKSSVGKNQRTTHPHFSSAPTNLITWSIVSAVKGLESDVVIFAALTNIETDWHRSVAYVGTPRAPTRLHVIIHQDCDGKRREREVEWEGDVEMML